MRYDLHECGSLWTGVVNGSVHGLKQITLDRLYPTGDSWTHLELKQIFFHIIRYISYFLFKVLSEMSEVVAGEEVLVELSGGS